MRLRTVGLVLFLSAFIALPAWGQEWEMAQKDALHTGAVEEGPPPPLRRAWRALSGDSESSFTTWPVVVRGVVYARSGPGVIAVEAETGETVWWRKNEEGSTQISPITGAIHVYLSVPAGRFIALDPQTGQEIWRFQAKDELDASSVLADGRIYVGSAKARTVYCLDSATGNLLWEKEFDLEPDSVPAVADGVVVFSIEHIGSDEAALIALDSQTGEQLWRVPQKEGNTSPSIMGDRVIIGGGDFSAYALDLRTGREVWKSLVEAKFNTRSMPALAFGDVFLADRIGNIYRLDGETGERKWFFDDTEGTMDQSAPIVAGKTLYIGSGAGFLYGVDVDSGRLVWEDRVRGIVLSGAADAERFYFGVKFGDEGLYAYEHDPEAPDTPIGGPRNPGLITTMFKGFAAFLVVLFVVILYAGYRKRRAAG